MNAETKHIVASNLTVAHSSARTNAPDISEEQIFEIYRRFLSLLNAQEKADSTGFKQTPGLPV